MSARAWWLFAAVSLLWGLPYLLIKIAVDELSPGFVAWSRLVIAALVLLPLALRRDAFRGLPKLPLIAFATVELVIPWPLIAFGEQHVSSSLAAILIATVPLFVALIAIGNRGSTRPSASGVGGLLIGLIGVGALAGIDLSGGTGVLAGAAAILVAALGYAVGATLLKRYFAGADPLGPIAAAMAIGAVMLAPLGVAGLPSEMPSSDALASLALLGTLCSALAFLLFFRLVALADPGRASVITYVNPVVALALGVPLLGEPITLATLEGFVLILAGSWLSTSSDSVVRPAFARGDSDRDADHGAHGWPQRQAGLRAPDEIERKGRPRVHASDPYPRVRRGQVAHDREPDAVAVGDRSLPGIVMRL
jgi:drug/metabolite transporter (DMT)-like permease